MTVNTVLPLSRSVAPGVGFGASSNFLDQYGPTQQIQKVARVATWNLQWQVKGFVAARPNVDSRILTGRFVDGSDVEGIDLKASVVNTSWKSLDQATCRLLLINTIALFETWCYEFTTIFGHFGNITAAIQHRMQGSLQWPDSYRGSSKIGILGTIQQLATVAGNSPGMAALMGPMQPTPVNTSTFSPRMRIYRLFKEARNSIAHQGAISTQSLCDAFADCQNIRPADLGMRVVPDFPAPTLGRQVTLSWNGIIGLADMLRRLVVDVDHCLMFSQTAMLDLSERIRVDPAALVDPTQADVLIKHRNWAKIPGGPFIAVNSQLPAGQRAVGHAIVRLLNRGTFPREELLPLWPELIAAGAVEVRQNLRDL